MSVPTIATATCALLFTLSSEAASVIWHDFYMSDVQTTYVGVGDRPAVSLSVYVSGATPEIGLYYTTNTRGQYLTATGCFELANCGNNSAIWALASCGETIATRSDLTGHTELFNWDTVDSPQGSIELTAQTSTYYLAILGYELDNDDPSYWGWVELEGNRRTGLSVVSAATSRDAPLIVGGGFAAIPEPTSGLLLLLGSAMLLIRRPRS